MSNSPSDMWSDGIGHTTTITPLELMKQQAQALLSHTGGLVNAVVTVSASDQMFASAFTTTISPVRPTRPVFEATFWLEAPTIQYKFSLFSVKYGLKIWPLDICGIGEPVQVSDQPAFEAALRALISSDRTTNIVRTLMAHAALG